jgi:NhaA family Na+:H+ antiporter
LIVIFFFVVGLEVKRERISGELRELPVAALPVAAALGGMVTPAALYLSFQ